MALCLINCLVLFALLLAANPAFCATTARELVTPKGLRVWLIEDHSTPLLTLGFRFAGGATQDQPGKEGLAHFTAEMFLQGAGTMPVETYLRAWSEIGAEATIEARHESLRGTLKVLKQDRDKAADLLAITIGEPRLAETTLNEVRDQVLSDIEHDAADPETIAYDAYGRLAYGTHRLARPLIGTRQGLAAISAADIARYRRNVLTLDGLTLSAVGDITPAELAPMVDRIFAGLPAHGTVLALQPPAVPRAQRSDLPLSASEAQVVFGVSLGQLNPRQRAMAELLNYTLGGSAFTSRLYRQIRDKRGLAYSIGTSLDTYSVLSEITGNFGAAPNKVEEALAITRAELAKLAADGPSDDEVAEAKAALAGQYLRGLITQVDLANELTLRMAQGFGADYVASYATRLADIAPAELRTFAREIAWLDRLVVVTVGARAEPAGATLATTGQRSRSQPPPAPEP